MHTIFPLCYSPSPPHKVTGISSSQFAKYLTKCSQEMHAINHEVVSGSIGTHPTVLGILLLCMKIQCVTCCVVFLASWRVVVHLYLWMFSTPVALTWVSKHGVQLASSGCGYCCCFQVKFDPSYLSLTPEHWPGLVSIHTLSFCLTLT